MCRISSLEASLKGTYVEVLEYSINIGSAHSFSSCFSVVNIEGREGEEGRERERGRERDENACLLVTIIMVSPSVELPIIACESGSNGALPSDPSLELASQT